MGDPRMSSASFGARPCVADCRGANQDQGKKISPSTGDLIQVAFLGQDQSCQAKLVDMKIQWSGGKSCRVLQRLVGRRAFEQGFENSQACGVAEGGQGLAKSRSQQLLNS